MRSSYIEGLKAQLVQDTKARQHSTLTQDRPPVQPLEQQVEALMRSLPASEANRMWLIGDLINAGLKGRYRENPHPQQLAAALYKLGWQRRRMYGSFGGRRFWIPPGVAGAA